MVNKYIAFKQWKTNNNGDTLRKTQLSAVFAFNLLLALVITNAPVRASWTNWINISAPPDTSWLNDLKVIAGVGGRLNTFLYNESGLWRGYYDDSGSYWQWDLIFSLQPNNDVVAYDVVLKSSGLFEVYTITFPDFSLWRIQQKPDQTFSAPELYPKPPYGDVYYVDAIEDSQGQVVLFANGVIYTTPKSLVGDASQWTLIRFSNDKEFYSKTIHLGEVRRDSNGHINLFFNVGQTLHSRYFEIWHLRQQKPGLFDWDVQKLDKPQQLGTTESLIQPLKVELNSKGAFELFTYGDEQAGKSAGSRIWHAVQDMQTGDWGVWDKFVNQPFTSSFAPPHIYPDFAIVKRKLSNRLTLFTKDSSEKVWIISETPYSSNPLGWGAWSRVTAWPLDEPGRRLREIEVAETANGKLWIFGIERSTDKLWLTKLDTISLKMKDLPKTIEEWMARCYNACIKTYCAGTKFIFMPDMSMEVFEPNPPTRQVCYEAAANAVAGMEALRFKLRKIGGDYLEKQKKAGSSFWAEEYLECQEKCQVFDLQPKD